MATPLATEFVAVDVDADAEEDDGTSPCVVTVVEAIFFKARSVVFLSPYRIIIHHRLTTTGR